MPHAEWVTPYSGALWIRVQQIHRASTHLSNACRRHPCLCRDFRYLRPLLTRITSLVFLNIREKDHALVTDNTAARKGMAYLLDLGHQRIAYIGRPRAKVESNERHRGYEQALRERNLSPDPRLIVTPSSWAAAEAGREGVEMLLRRPPLPTAVFCFNDLTAIGAIAAISAAGLRIPSDISVLGFDNNSLAPYTVPALSPSPNPSG